jgi:hypothetical protein
MSRFGYSAMCYVVDCYVGPDVAEEPGAFKLSREGCRQFSIQYLEIRIM